MILTYQYDNKINCGVCFCSSYLYNDNIHCFIYDNESDNLYHKRLCFLCLRCKKFLDKNNNGKQYHYFYYKPISKQKAEVMLKAQILK